MRGGRKGGCASGDSSGNDFRSCWAGLDCWTAVRPPSRANVERILSQTLGLSSCRCGYDPIQPDTRPACHLTPMPFIYISLLVPIRTPLASTDSAHHSPWHSLTRRRQGPTIFPGHAGRGQSGPQEAEAAPESSSAGRGGGTCGAAAPRARPVSLDGGAGKGCGKGGRSSGRKCGLGITFRRDAGYVRSRDAQIRTLL